MILGFRVYGHVSITELRVSSSICDYESQPSPRSPCSGAPQHGAARGPGCAGADDGGGGGVPRRQRRVHRARRGPLRAAAMEGMGYNISTNPFSAQPEPSLGWDRGGGWGGGWGWYSGRCRHEQDCGPMGRGRGVTQTLQSPNASRRKYSLELKEMYVC